MPPSDSWLQARRFGIVIDAGSSGSRLQIYSWRDASVVRNELGQDAFNRLPRVERGAQDSEDWISKVEPGISTFGQKPDDVAAYLQPLLDHATKHVPPSLHSETPIFLLATAGMRLLLKEQQDAVLSAACDFLRQNSKFKLDSPSPLGLCGSSIRIISGEEEGLFGWIAVNYLMDGFGRNNESATYGFLDMGGASTQMAFEPSQFERQQHSDNLIPIQLRLLGGNEIHHEVFVTTWLGYGTNQARERYVGKIISNYEKEQISQIDEEHEIIPDPCLPVGLIRKETGSSASRNKKQHRLRGTGSFEQCLKLTEPLLNKDKPCLDSPCLFNGVHVPPIDFSASHFIGVSEYWYSSEQVFGLGGPYDVVQYERAASDFCSQSWKDLVHEHDSSQKGADGLVKGKYKWDKSIEPSRLEMQCFKAAWIVNVLHEGIGLPRIVDPGGNEPGEGGKLVNEMAFQKGLSRPQFQSVDTIGGTAITWALGKMVWVASNEIPPAFPNSLPLKDPLDAISSMKHFFENRIAHRLPSSLSRHSLGFSLFALIFYIILFAMVLFILYRLRYHVRTVVRRFGRGSLKHEKAEIIFDSYALEESKIGVGSRPSTPSSGPPSPTGTGPNAGTLFNGVSHKLRRVFSSHALGRSSLSPATTKLSSYRHLHTSNNTSSQNGITSRSGSSTPTYVSENSYLPSNGTSHSLALLSQSRSRNSSQMNLTTLVPRSVPYSRSNSGQQAA